MEKSTSLKKAPLKTLRVLDPIKTSPFITGPHNKKRGSYRKGLYGGQSTPSSNQSFFSGRGKSNNRDFDMLNKRILIQQRALASLSESLAHILQRELYTMGNTGLLRHKAEITLLQPNLDDSRRQELRNSAFWPSTLFKSEFVKDGEEFLLKKGTHKESYQNKPFRGPHHNKKRGSYRKCPYGGQSTPSSNHSFSSGRGKSNNRLYRSRFQPHSRRMRALETTHPQ